MRFQPQMHTDKQGFITANKPDIQALNFAA